MQKPETPAAPAVFVIDDDASVRGAIGSLIRSVGLRTEVFASVSEFLAHKHSSTTSCLILDVRLPGVSGLEFQSELAKANAEIPIIFIRPWRYTHDSEGNEGWSCRVFDQTISRSGSVGCHPSRARTRPRERRKGQGCFRSEEKFFDFDAARTGDHGLGNRGFIEQ